MSRGFSRLSVTGFRRLKSVDLALRPLNVLIGANGVGKSTVLDVFRLLAASAEGRLARTVAELGSFPLLLTADGATSQIALKVRVPDDGSLSSYDLNLMLAGVSYYISEEVLSHHVRDSLSPPSRSIESDGTEIRYGFGDSYISPNWEYERSETALSQTPKNNVRAERFRRTLADISGLHHGLDVSRRAPVRTPQTLSPAMTPGVNGEDLVSCLFNMRETARERFDAVEDALRVAFPTMERLEYLTVGGGNLALGWKESVFTRSVYASELSEGTLRFLWLAALLQSPGLPRITLIDEPEVSLHPEMLRLLADLMREASERTQLVVVTHSDQFVRFLEPEELIVCDLDESGGMTAKRADEFDLKAWLADYTLDQLWSKGIIGGRS